MLCLYKYGAASVTSYAEIAAELCSYIEGREAMARKRLASVLKWMRDEDWVRIYGNTPRPEVGARLGRADLDEYCSTGRFATVFDNWEDFIAMASMKGYGA